MFHAIVPPALPTPPLHVGRPDIAETAGSPFRNCPPMLATIARIRFVWDPDFTRCRASAYAADDSVLGEVLIEMPAETRRRIWATRAGSAHFRIEEVAERHLRGMLDLRY
jgi:hypothetical protein